MVEKYVLGDMRFYPCILLVDNSPNALDWWSLPREWHRPDFLLVWDNVASGYGNWFIIFNEDIRKIVAQYSSFFIFTFYVTYRSCVYENCIVPMEGTLQNRTSRIVYTNIIRAKRVSNWYIPKKKSARVHACTHACTRVRLLLVLVCRIMYHIRTYLRICRYVCTRATYTYVFGLGSCNFLYVRTSCVLRHPVLYC